MFSFNKKSKGSAEIHFTSDAVDNTANTGRSVWKTNENVKGYAVFKLPPGVEFARSKIVLKGSSLQFTTVYSILTYILQESSPQGQMIPGLVVSNDLGEPRSCR